MSLTITAAAAMVGATGDLRDVNGSGLVFRVRVADVRLAYGCVRFLVEPVEGSGRAWVDGSRLALSGRGVEGA